MRVLRIAAPPIGWFWINRSLRTGGQATLPLLLGALLLLCGNAAPLRATTASEDWPQFLGLRADNTSKETGLLDRFPAGGPRVIWSKAIGPGYSAPSVRGDRLVAHHRAGNEEVVECLDATSGEPRWRYAYPSDFTDPYGYNNGPRCTPLLTTNRCYTFGAEGKLLCLDLQNGRLLWQRDTAKDWEVPAAFFGVGSSPVLEDGRLIVMVGGQPNSGVVAFDAATGKTLWESVGQKNWQGVPMTGTPGARAVVWNRNDKQASYATPVLATIHGKRHALCLMRQGLVSLDPKSGDVNFSFWFRSPANESVNAMTPVVVNDLVFISGAYYRVGSVLLRVKPDGKSVEEVWRGTQLELHWNTPVYHEGYLYAFTGRNEPDARFRCVDFLTGRVQWDRDESWPMHAGYRMPQPQVYGRGSAIMADGKLIVLGEGGLLGLFKVNHERPEEISRWQVPELKYPCWAGPVLAGRKVYLRGESRLICLDFAGEQKAGDPGRTSTAP